MMSEFEIYNTIRSEIMINHVLMHVTTLVVVVFLLGGIWLVESRASMLSIVLPLLSLAWAAAVVRFDFFIHRQAAYLRVVESRLQESGTSIPLWETWKLSLRSTSIVVPVADLIAMLVILVPTIYLLFGPAQEFFGAKQWQGGKAFAWGILIILGFLIGCLPFIPKIAQQ
jgi:type IV secretory pathway VirB2 component (pilin)